MILGFGSVPPDPAAMARVLRNAAVIGAAILVLLACFHCTGCGGGALAMQARAATVAAATVHATADAVRHAADADARATCPTAEDACLDGVKAKWAPIDVAVESAHAALDVWIGAIQIAEASDGDGEVIAALLVTAGRLLEAWDALAAALHAVGVEVPVLPAWLRALVVPDPAGAS